MLSRPCLFAPVAAAIPAPPPTDPAPTASLAAAALTLRKAGPGTRGWLGRARRLPKPASAAPTPAAPAIAAPTSASSGVLALLALTPAPMPTRPPPPTLPVLVRDGLDLAAPLLSVGHRPMPGAGVGD